MVLLLNAVLHHTDHHARTHTAMRPGPSRYTTAATLRLFAAGVLLHAATALSAEQSQNVATSSSSVIQHHPSPPPFLPTPSASAAFHSVPFRIAAAGGTLLEKIGQFVEDLLLPDLQQSSFNEENQDLDFSNGGLFGGDEGTTLAWGGSTLEVVKTQASYLTRPAAFGPRIVDDEGLRGTLLPISDFYTPKHFVDAQGVHDALSIDNYGCPYEGGPGWRHDEDQDDERNKFPGEEVVHTVVKHSPPPSDWIALIERGGNCSFVSKVRVAQALDAKAVVVGDAPGPGREGSDDDIGFSGRLVTMFAPGDTHDITIPSTFVTRPSYVDLIRLIEESSQEQQERCAKEHKQSGDGNVCDKDEKRGVEVILWRDDVMWEWPLIDLAFILLMLPSFMTLVTIVVHRVRMIHKRRKERAPELAVSNLPCLIWRGNGQPWEKVEDADIMGGRVLHDGEGSMSRARIAADKLVVIRTRMGAWLGKRLHRRSADMEADAADAEGADTSGLPLAPSLHHNDDCIREDGLSSSEAGPSTLPSSSAGPSSIVPLKTTPVAPPKPPSDRTYYSCDECAICLSEFVDGDLVRVLPCGHVFHLAEIDSWLTRVKGLCPICKRDITVPPAPPIPSIHPPSTPTVNTTSTPPANANATTNDHAAAAGEETPLLADHDV